MFMPVSYGAFATFLGIVLLSDAQYSSLSLSLPLFLSVSAVFGFHVVVCCLCVHRFQYFKRYFFDMYILIIVLGYVHGVILLPVVLSLIGPPTVSSGLPSLCFCVCRFVCMGSDCCCLFVVDDAKPLTTPTTTNGSPNGNTQTGEAVLLCASIHLLVASYSLFLADSTSTASSSAPPTPLVPARTLADAGSNGHGNGAAVAEVQLSLLNPQIEGQPNLGPSSSGTCLFAFLLRDLDCVFV